MTNGLSVALLRKSLGISEQRAKELESLIG